MATQIQCPHCGQTYGLTDQQVPQYAGQTINCTKCQKPFTVAADLGRDAGVAPPSFPSATPMQSPQGAPLNYGQPRGQYLQQKGNGFAVTSVVCGAIAMIIPIIPAILGVIFGIIGLRKTKDPAVGGKGMAITGISLSAFSIVPMMCMISIMLPALNRARETANRVKCSVNLQMIGNALLLYSNDNRGQYPPNLEALLISQDFGSQVLVCPASDHTPAPGGTAAEQAANLSKAGHLSYVYVGNGMRSNASANTVVVYELLEDHGLAGGNFLFADGHVDWLSKADAQRFIDQLKAGRNPPR